MICITAKPKPKRWLSPTSINTYLRCPRKFYLQYIKRLKTKPNIHMLRGNAVHKTLERFFSEGYGDHAHYDDLRNGILGLLQDEWQSREKQFKALDMNRDELAFFYKDSQKMVINFLHDHLKSGHPAGKSGDLEVKIFSEKWRTMCIIDRIIWARSPPEITDYKTCKSADVRDEYRIQMGICALLFEGKYGQKPNAKIHFLKFLKGIRDVDLSEDFMDNLKRTIMDIHEKTESEDPEDYPCTCGGWCKNDFAVT